MGDMLIWLLFFFIVVAILVMVIFQLISLTDLEFDYINPYETASRINKVVLPEFITQGVLCFLYLVTGHWAMSLYCVPYLYYNVNLYRLCCADSSFLRPNPSRRDTGAGAGAGCVSDSVNPIRIL
ncbi:hypothetical protein AABB24_013630 [Solanum stoloniferum]|uniref:Cornichon family protein n=1 Tax=Solanum stoloniferum TaxID=62892 RepID=A0ABD2TV24_9SOLN